MIKKQKHPLIGGKTVVIVGPRPFSLRALLPFLKDPETELVFVDGGLVHKDRLLKKAPALTKKALSLGDGDGSKRPMDLKKIDQNLSDFSFFLKTYTKKPGIKTFYFAGFLGGRLDHELMNLGESAHFLKGKKNPPRFLFEDRIEVLPAGGHHFTLQGTFSVALFEKGEVKISGLCAYPTKGWVKLAPFSSRGLSNRGHGEVFIQCKKPLALFLPRATKE